MPPLRRHCICDIVDIEGVTLEGYDADERFPHDLKVGREHGVGADGGFDELGGADNTMAGLGVAVFADGEEGRPAGCYSV